MPVAVDEVLAAAASTGEEIIALTELIDQAQAALVERVAAFDAEQGWEADGAYSFACWLRARADVSRSDASRLHRFTRTLRTMPATQAAVNRRQAVADQGAGAGRGHQPADPGPVRRA